MPTVDYSVNTDYVHISAPARITGSWIIGPDMVRRKRRWNKLKGWPLLESLLTAEQIEDLHQDRSRIKIKGSSGRIWTYYPLEHFYSIVSGNSRYCLIPQGNITVCDRIIAMKMMLENDDAVIKQVAIADNGWDDVDDAPFSTTTEYYASAKGQRAAARIAERRAKRAVQEE